MPPLDFEFLKDRYDFELERKNKLTGDLALPVGVLSGLGGLVATMARSFTDEYLPLQQELETARDDWRAFYGEIGEKGADEDFSTRSSASV